MSDASQDDAKETQPPRPPLAAPAPAQPTAESIPMTSFVESCVETAISRAASVARGTRHRPRAGRLLNVLKGKKRILLTTHQYPDPDALASTHALAHLLNLKLKGPQVTVSVKGNIAGGYNKAFLALTDFKSVPFEQINVADYDAILLLDVQPNFKLSPLPSGITPTAVIDHHRSPGRRPKCDFCDIRTDVGATSSIIFSYFMELEVEIPSDLAATLLFAIETDLAGAAGQPGELDNMALSSLTLTADTRRLYKMRYADLPLSIYAAYASGLSNAVYFDSVLISHLDTIDSAEAPAVLADFLLRYEPIEWVLVTALNPAGNLLMMSLRTADTKASAAEMMRRLTRGVGDGGGHRTKAGGAIPLPTGTPTEIERARQLLRRRLLRSLHIPTSKGQRLVPGNFAKPA